MESDLEKKAREFRERHGIFDSHKTQSDHPVVEVARLLSESATLLADDHNEAFSQLDKGKFANVFIDETKDFALAYVFATHPLDDIQNELMEMGITVKKKVTEKIIDNGKEIEVTTEKDFPICFEVTPLKIFIEEWLRKRHAVNRKRVKEFTDIVTGQSQRIKDNLVNPYGTNPHEPQQRGRIA